MRVTTVKLTFLIVIVLLLLSSSQAQSVSIPAAGVIETIAGETTTGFPVFNGDGQLALTATLFSPRGVAVDGSGNIYITDSGFSRIREVNFTTGIITTIAGTGKQGFSGDTGPAIDAEIYVGSAGENLALDGEGNVYFVDETCRIREVTAATGEINTVVGTGTCGYSGDGGLATEAKMGYPRGIAVDATGDIYLADDYRIRKVTASTGMISTVAGNGTEICCGRSMSYGDGGLATDAELSDPSGVAIDSAGDIYIADIGASRIRKVTAQTGIITTIAGNGGSCGSGVGGPAIDAAVCNPNAIAIDPAGNLYIAEGYSKISKIMASTQIITTIAGDGTAGALGDGGQAINAEVYAEGLAVDAIGNIYLSQQSASGDSYTDSVRVVAGNAVTGFINPKYVIVGVTYAPPGPSSFVQYQTSTLIGSTTAYTNSFTNTITNSIAISAKILAWGTGGKITGTESTTTTQGSSSSYSTTVSAQTSTGYKTVGTPNSMAPVDNDYDSIYLWLNPLLIYKVNPDIPGSVQWNGYGYDPTDPAGTVDIYPLYVGQLNGDLTIDPSTAGEISRTWASGEIWPAGQGPGLTSSDFSTIITADPFSNSEYQLPNPLPSSGNSTPDGRFTNVGADFAYAQAGQGDSAGLTDLYGTTNVSSTVSGIGTTSSFQQMFGMEEQGTFLSFLTADLKQSDTLTWSDTWQSTLTKTVTLTNNLSITGPGCPNPAPCPAYSGPAEFELMQDNQYGTFMFAPVN